MRYTTFAFVLRGAQTASAADGFLVAPQSYMGLCSRQSQIGTVEVTVKHMPAHSHAAVEPVLTVATTPSLPAPPRCFRFIMRPVPVPRPRGKPSDALHSLQLKIKIFSILSQRCLWFMPHLLSSLFRVLTHLGVRGRP